MTVFKKFHVKAQLFLCILTSIILFTASYLHAADVIMKYYIFSMKTVEDERKVVQFIKDFPGVSKVETVLDRHWVMVYLDDEILEDERFELRVLLKEKGYPIDRWDILLEKDINR
jgi:hypothetical protein